MEMLFFCGLQDTIYVYRKLMKDKTNAVNTIYLTRTAFKEFMFLSARKHCEAANSNIWERMIIIIK